MLIFIIAVRHVIGATAILTAFPSNTAVIVGSEVILQCRTNASKKLIWRQRLLNAREKDGPLGIIFSGSRLSNEAAHSYDIIRESEGQFDLRFNAALHHGSEYMCLEPGGDNFSSEVIVFAAEPKCYVNGLSVISNLILVDEDEYVQLKCNLTFAGRWSPTLEWTQQINSEKEWADYADSVVDVNQKETERRERIYFISSTLGFNATHNVTSFTCTTRFIENNRPKTSIDKNIPDWSCNWTSPTFVLKSFYESSNIFVKQENYHTADSFEMTGWALVTLLLGVLLFMSVSLTICVTLHFTICRKNTGAQKHEEMSPSAPSSMDVDSLVTISIAIRSEGEHTSVPTYEEVDLEPSAVRVIVDEAIGDISSCNKYSALVRSNMSPPKPHNYEKIELS